MKGINLKLNPFDQVKLRTLDSYSDIRGYTFEQYRANTMPVPFVQGTVALSRYHSLRGLHGDYKTYKLLTVLMGEIHYVCVDVRKDSPAYCQWAYATLEPRGQILLPPGFVQGYYALDDALVQYEVSEYYDTHTQMTIRYDEPKFGIEWPFNDAPLLSQRDKYTDFNGIIDAL